MKKKNQLKNEDKSLLFFHKEDLLVLDYELQEKGALWVQFCNKNHSQTTVEEIKIPFNSVCESLEQRYGDDFYYKTLYNRNEIQRHLAFRRDYWDTYLVEFTDGVLIILKEELEYGSVSDFSQANLQGVWMEIFSDMQVRVSKEALEETKAQVEIMNKKIMKLEAKQIQFSQWMGITQKVIQDLAMDAIAGKIGTSPQEKLVHPPTASQS